MPADRPSRAPARWRRFGGIALGAVASTAWIAPLVVASLLGSASSARGVSSTAAAPRPGTIAADGRALSGPLLARPAVPPAVAIPVERSRLAPQGAIVRAAHVRRPGELSRFMASDRFEYFTMVRRLAARHAVELKLVMAIIASESGGDPAAVSPCGAIGLMQLMPETAARLGVDPWDPEQNVDGAVRYLSSLLSSFGSVDLSLVAYNAGPGFAERYRAGAVELGAETRAFLIRIGRMLER